MATEEEVEKHTVYVEEGVRRAVIEIAHRNDEALLRCGERLAGRGIDIKRYGEPTIVIGQHITKPLSELDFGGNKNNILVYSSDERVDMAKELFGEEDNSVALRKAIKLGVICKSQRKPFISNLDSLDGCVWGDY